MTTIVLPPLAQATSGGSPYASPLAVDINPAPNVFETNLVAAQTTVDIGGGVMANAWTYNGTIPGPQIRVKVGDTVIVHFTSNLPGHHDTGIHWHGIELDNQSDGTSITQKGVLPGESFLYKFTVPRPGIYWYHPHTHFSTNQAFRGLYGSIIVTDPNEAALIGAGVLPGASATRTMVLSDTTVCKTPGTNDTVTYPASLPWVGNPGGNPPMPAQPGPTPQQLCENPTAMDEHGVPGAPSFAAGDIPAIQRGDAGRTNEGQTVLTNGMNVGGRAGTPATPGALAPGASTLNVAPGQGLRLQFVNAATTRFFRLRLTTNTGVQIPLVEVGGDNGLFNSAVVNGGVQQGIDFQYDTGELLLDPGDRADVIAAIPASASGVATLWTEDLLRTGAGLSKVPTVPVAHFNVTGPAGSYSIGAGSPVLSAVGASVPVLGPPTGTLLDPATFAPPEIGSANQTLTLTNNAATLAFDNAQGWQQEYDPYETTPHISSTRWAKVGDTIELSVTNTTDAHHPYHLHGFSMQPLSLTVGAMTFTYNNQATFEDNVDIPAATTFRFRVRLDDHPQIDGTTAGGALGRWMMHCHIFFHHTLGMVSELVVVKDATGLERPYVDATLTEVDALIGGPALAAGTFVDPNGLPVTLSASVGTVVASPGGTWSWSLPTSVGMPAQIVYITATNSAGAVGQAAFQLRPRRAIISGSGTVASPAGAFAANPALTGSASFGFNTSFERGGGAPASPPVGSVSFGFGGAGFNFTGTSQTDLALQGGTGRVSGTGTVNGVAGYSFRVNFVDGSPDRFRIKVWNTATTAVVYDNLPGGADNAVPPPITAGAITIANK